MSKFDPRIEGDLCNTPLHDYTTSRDGLVPKLLYANFDGLDVAFQGCLPHETLELLEHTREKAQQTQTPVLVILGDKGFEAHVHETGRRGGYRFHLSTGPLGAMYWFKSNAGARNWNIFVSVGSAMLLDRGYHGAKEQILLDLANMGALIGKESVNRVDFAMDFLMPVDFELRVDQFVAHPHAKVAPYMGEKEGAQDDTALATVLQGRKVRTVTIGKMPGRQVITYDKRRDAIAKHKFYWFDVWGIDRKDKTQQIWRIEVRAGKHHLKEQWGLSTFTEIEDAYGDVARLALDKVRYLDGKSISKQTNVTRAVLHPLWKLAQETVVASLSEMQSGLLPGQMKESLRTQIVSRYRGLIAGNVAGLAVTLDIPDAQLKNGLKKELEALLDRELAGQHEAFSRRMKRARDKYRFL